MPRLTLRNTAGCCILSVAQWHLKEEEVFLHSSLVQNMFDKKLTFNRRLSLTCQLCLFVTP